MKRPLVAGLILSTIVLFAACGDGSGDGSSTPPPGGPLLGTQQCDPMSDLCVHTHTELFAISHAFVDPDNTVYYRVTVPAWRTGTDWGDGTNGFFYRATVTGNGTKTATYVPFNGVSIGADDRPMMPQFTFIVEADVSMGEASTTLAIDACATNYAGGATTECTQTLWTDTYSGLPVPAVGFGPADAPFFQGPNVLFDAETGSDAEIPNNGVYPVPLLICPTAPGSSSCATESTYTAEQLQWIYDHLIFFDLEGKPYTNDLFTDSAQHRSIGVLTIDEAAYPISARQYRTRYGSTSAFGAEAAPEKQFFFYTRNGSSTAITVGVQLLYDSEDCNGNLNQVGCGSPNVTGTVTITPAAAISPLTEQRGGVTAFPANTNLTAGLAETRTITFRAAGESARCAQAVNPLAVNRGGEPSNLPNYVIERQLGDGNWGAVFPPALYYVLPTGFGNCFTQQGNALISNAPFCDRGSGYVGYVPHYSDADGGADTLNGGSTADPLVGSFTVADQYSVGDVDDLGANALVWFDNCGFGYTYEECTAGSGLSCLNPLGTRESVSTVSLPNNRTEMLYDVENSLPHAIVVGKECCASFYQENSETGTFEPPQGIDDGFGIFLGAPDSDGTARSFTYRTIFENEMMVIYHGATGQRSFKTVFGASSPALYRCEDASPVMAVQSGSGSTRVTFGTGSIGCEPFPQCPIGMTVGTDGDYVTCSTETSNYLLGVEDWADQHLFGITSVQLRAWSGTGAAGSQSGGPGGQRGFALTVRRPSELAAGMFAYVASGHSNSSVLTSAALSSPQIDLENLPPDLGPVLLIAGGPGQGGRGVDGKTGGDGALAVANADPKGTLVSTYGPGTGSNAWGAGGHPGNEDGVGGGGKAGSFSDNNVHGEADAGTSGIGDGVWKTDGTLVFASSWPQGSGGGGKDGGGYGGGGFGGGGGGYGADGSYYGNAGGGGGTFAGGNTVYDPGAPATLPTPPGFSGVGGLIQIAYLPDPSETCTFVSSPEPAVRCGFSTSGLPLDIDELLAEVVAVSAFDLPLDEVPVSVEAWGGRGGKGGDAEVVYPENAVYANGGGHGGSGYARSTLTVSNLQNDFSAGAYVYVGMQGPDGPGHTREGSRAVGTPGSGGAATLVLSGPLSSATQMGDVLLIAGGGGGGGQANAGHIPYDGRDGGQGGSAAATVDADASGAGTPRGQGGADGVGACSVGDIGSRCGDDGIGGMGGNAGSGRTGWVGSSLQLGLGQGGASRGGDDDGGAGGGGFGGGETGDAASGIPDAGGGGGGSWARRATVDDSSLPFLGEANPPVTDSGSVVFTFAICAVYPDEFGCE
jgi:hypothetical protein